jgi:putative ABC transport system permease protein
MTREHIKMAVSTIRASRLRSTMTMFGIIIGVASVITVIGLGQGLRNQVTNQITKLGSNLIIVLPGKQASSQVINFGLLQNLGGGAGGVIAQNDLVTVSKTPSVALVAPVATINGLPNADDKTMDTAVVVGTTDALPVILSKKVEYGTFFSKESLGKNYAVIGHNVAEQLFNENVPIGKTFKVKNAEFIVQGVFEQSPATPLSPSINFNNAVVIGFDKAKEIADGSLHINQILLTTKSADNTAEVAKNLKASLLINHGKQEDFSVLRQQETLAISDGIFQQLTLFVTWVAVISLLVGGIGIMNVMFASVSERTREIGIRKAVGATNRQIVSQFVTEAIILSLTGGIIGIVIALLIIAAIRSTTSFEPAISLPAIGIAAGVSVSIGILSGILPAIKASQKDPIDSLRRA